MVRLAHTQASAPTKFYIGYFTISTDVHLKLVDACDKVTLTNNGAEACVSGDAMTGLNIRNITSCKCPAQIESTTRILYF